MFDKWLPHVDAIAGKLGKALTKYGYEPDDVLQEARLKWIKLSRSPRILNVPENEMEQYLHVSIRRAVFRAAAKKKNLFVPLKDRFLLTAAARGLSNLEQFIKDVLLDAPHRVRRYLEVQLNLVKEDDSEPCRRTREVDRYLEGQLQGA